MTETRQFDLEKSTNVRFPGLVRFVMRTGSQLAPKFAARRFASQFLTPMRAPTPERELRWTAGASRHHVRSGDYDLAVWSAGLGGPQILLVHGWSGRGSQLGAFIEPLVRAGFEVNWFDLPAHGKSTGRQAGLVHAVEAVERVVDWLGGVHTVVGHSMGAAATTVAASRGADIGRMAYLAPPDDVGSYLPIVGKMIGLSSDVIEDAQRVIEARYGILFDDFIPTRYAACLEQPLLALHDPSDLEVSVAEVERLVELWPDSKLHLTEGLSHRRIVRDARVVSCVVDYVSERPNGNRRRRAA